MNKSFQLVEGAASGAFHFEEIYPAVDCGRFPVKRFTGERVEVWADIYRDGSGITKASLVWRQEGEREWERAPMTHHTDDRWVGAFVPEQPGRYVYAIEAWTDEFATWRDAFANKHQAGADTTVDAIEGAGMLTKARAGGANATAVILRQCEMFLQTGDVTALLTDDLMEAMDESQFRSDLSRSQLFPLVVDRARAGFGAWYEMTPRSQGATEGKHATFEDCTARLADIAAMGFDVICLSPIHPIGWTHRKGRNKNFPAMDGDPGSPYAIGSDEGGHDAIHPSLGTFEDFQGLLSEARKLDLEIALDFAIQASPDHPWLKQHPGWFSWRPDGTIRYAENPPKKYEDIVNLDFYAEGATPSLWVALRDTIRFWIDQGVLLFRVDNPHTKPFPFWDWVIDDIRREHPEVVFLAEAFTRPKVMYRLAKAGFSQSYTYFTWRNTKWELTSYLTELTNEPLTGFFRPHFFVNTPDINPDFLQNAPRPAFLIRAALAATLSGLWGVYNGFELCEGKPDPQRKE